MSTDTKVETLWYLLTAFQLLLFSPFSSHGAAKDGASSIPYIYRSAAIYRQAASCAAFIAPANRNKITNII